MWTRFQWPGGGGGGGGGGGEEEREGGADDIYPGQGGAGQG